MRAERSRLSRHAETAKAINYMLKRWTAFTRFLDDGRICLTNNAAERALRGIALGRKAWLFGGSDRGGERAAAIYTLIGTAKLNDVARKPGSPTCYGASPTIRPPASTNCCPGIGRKPSIAPSQPDPTAQRPSPDAYVDRRQPVNAVVSLKDGKPQPLPAPAIKAVVDRPCRPGAVAPRRAPERSM
jgi:hypothetical protein